MLLPLLQTLQKVPLLLAVRNAKSAAKCAIHVVSERTWPPAPVGIRVRVVVVPVVKVAAAARENERRERRNDIISTRIPVCAKKLLCVV